MTDQRRIVIQKGLGGPPHGALPSVWTRNEPHFLSAPNRAARARGAGVTAVLGPTNTGKTHLAIERMLAHSSGMIGLPLRLLAREVYNKVRRPGRRRRASR